MQQGSWRALSHARIIILLALISLLYACSPKGEAGSLPEQINFYVDPVSSKESRFEACQVPFDYGQWTSRYLKLATSGKQKEVGNELVKLYRRLSCTSHNEYTQYNQAIQTMLIVPTLDDKPVLSMEQQAMVPVVMLLNDVAFSGEGAYYQYWLRVNEAAITESLKNGLLAKIGVYFIFNDNLRLASESEHKKIVEFIANETSSQCSISEIANTGLEIAFCPRDCEALERGDGIYETASGQDVTDYCELITEFNSALELPEFVDQQKNCIDEYLENVEAEKVRTDLAMCMRNKFVQNRERRFGLGFNLQAEFTVSNQCELSETPPEGGEPLGDTSGCGSSSRDLAMCLYLEHKQKQLQNGRNKDHVSDLELEESRQKMEQAFKARELALEEAKRKREEERRRQQEQKEGKENCPPDVEGCEDGCTPMDQNAQDTLACLAAASGQSPILGDPDPIDPLDPVTDPNSPLGKLSACLNKAAGVLAMNSDKNCEATMRCLDGQTPENINGVCSCSSVDGSSMPVKGNQCEEVIQCLPDQPCSCGGAELSGGEVLPSPNGPGVGPQVISDLSF